MLKGHGPPVHDLSIYATQLEQRHPILQEHIFISEYFSSKCCHIQRRTTAFRPTRFVMSTAGDIRMSLVVRQKNS